MSKKHNITAVDLDRQPQTFIPDEYFCAFKDNQDLIIGYGNVVMDYEKEGLFYIENIETTDESNKGSGRLVIEYLLSESPTHVLKGQYTKDSRSFWEHIGATLYNINDFILTSITYKPKIH